MIPIVSFTPLRFLQPEPYRDETASFVVFASGYRPGTKRKSASFLSVTHRVYGQNGGCNRELRQFRWQSFDLSFEVRLEEG